MFPSPTVLKACHLNLSKSSPPHRPHAGFASRISHRLVEHGIPISPLASSDGAVLDVQTQPSLSRFTGLAQEGRGRVQILVYDDSGIFPDAKCIIPLVPLCLPRESMTTELQNTAE